MVKDKFLFIYFLYIVFITKGILWAISPEVYKLNEQGINQIKSGNYEQAIELLRTAHNYEPYNEVIRKNLAIAYNNYGYALMQKGQMSLAEEKLAYAYYYDPENAYICYNLSQLYYNLQNLEKAKIYLEKAIKIAPSLQGAKQLLTKIYKEKKEQGFEYLPTSHFIIAFSPQEEISKISYIRTYLEEAYGRIGAFLDYYPSKKVAVILYNDQDYYRIVSGKPHWSMGFYDGKIRIPLAKYKYTNEDLIKIIYHEYTHVIIHELTKGRCPLWLNEGIAAKAEDYISSRDLAMVKDYFDKFGYIPLEHIPDNFSKIKDIKYATFLYMESYLAVNFLLKQVGNQGIRDILSLLAEGKDWKKTLEGILKTELTSFQRQLQLYIKEKTSF